MKFRLIAALAGALLLAAPAVAQETAEPATDARPYVIPGKIKAPPAGKGRIVFFRESTMLGAAISYKVRTGADGQTVLGTLSAGSYFVVDADPGAFTFTAATESKDAITLEVEEGEMYWVEGKIQAGAFVARPNLAPSNQATFEKQMKYLKRAK